MFIPIHFKRKFYTFLLLFNIIIVYMLTNLDVLYSAKSFVPFHILSPISICVCLSNFFGGGGVFLRNAGERFVWCFHVFLQAKNCEEKSSENGSKIERKILLYG